MIGFLTRSFLVMDIGWWWIILTGFRIRSFYFFIAIFIYCTTIHYIYTYTFIPLYHLTPSQIWYKMIWLLFSAFLILFDRKYMGSEECIRSNESSSIRSFMYSSFFLSFVQFLWFQKMNQPPTQHLINQL